MFVNNRVCYIRVFVNNRVRCNRVGITPFTSHISISFNTFFSRHFLCYELMLHSCFILVCLFVLLASFRSLFFSQIFQSTNLLGQSPRIIPIIKMQTQKVIFVPKNNILCSSALVFLSQNYQNLKLRNAQ